MAKISYQWTSDQGEHALELVRVEGTNGRPYRFGDGDQTRFVEVKEFWLATVTVTQAHWLHVMGDGNNPAVNHGPQHPVENVSWDTIAQPGGFVARINESPIRMHMLAHTSLSAGIFRLPNETEWEYAARGGPHWQDGFLYSGSNDIDLVAWHDRKDGDHTHDVAQKLPNQLGLFDMSGNVWEWCQDVFTRDVQQIPDDGSAFAEEGDERILRGCFHIGPCTAPCSNDMRSGTTFTMVVSVFGSLFLLCHRDSGQRQRPLGQRCSNLDWGLGKPVQRPI
jgi:formylglycine-generating enzyme required for sulfatase activity